MKTATTYHFTGEEAGLKERQDWPRVAAGVMPSLLRVSPRSPAPHLNEIESQRRPLCAAQGEPCGQEVPLCLHLPFIPDSCRARAPDPGASPEPCLPDSHRTQSLAHAPDSGQG